MLDDELMLEIVLSERSVTAFGNQMAAEVGERLNAAKHRIDGAVNAAEALGRLNGALQQGGWNGSDPVTVRIVDSDHEEGAPGREWALRGAIVDAIISAPAATIDPVSATNAFIGAAPEKAVSFGTDNGNLVATIRYLGSRAANGRSELAGLLRDAGFQVES